MIGTNLASESCTSRARRQRVPPASLGKYLCCRSLLLWIIALVEGISCLRLLEMSAPSAAIHGRGMWLNCSFDLESDELYSVKWYKNDTEFYRYIPRDRPPAQNYDLPGVVVDMSRSREGHVFISSVNLSSEGNYRCEASAEAPSFQTVVGEKEIKVFVIPDYPPKIRGTRAKYEVGERLDVSCRAPYSLPAAKLVWYINDQEVPFSDVRELETLYDSEGLQSSAVLLSFVLQPYHMIGSSLRLKCVSVISETFLTSSEELIVGDTVPSIPYPEASPHSPRIDGGLPKYRVNDLVNLTCRSAEYDRPPELRWFINDKEARPEYLVRYEVHRYPKYAASLGLRFRVRPEHFEEERMHLRCTVTLSNVLNTSSAEASIKNKHRTMSGFRAASKDATNGAASILAPLLSSLLVFIALSKL
ncbi:uncharacterized protein LOC119393397 isoform X1 [Rhipicephalus sanguineus]|uniref:uncharacterized protein LOC119393397 isoform X1 n=2 Tax=Rhipicephalus sanguineus TaxID=34632 RepID=UPI0018948E6D|nr:uncharacterized protein LOC119393397 isoform X1 [Rhipicephalus sanguineus]